MDINGFREALETTPWWVSSVFEETDDVLNAWELLYNSVVDEYIKVRKAKVRTDSLPWVTTDIRKIMNRRYRLLNKWQRDKDPQTHHQYKEARNLVRKELRKAESKYWRQEFEKAKKAKEFWQTVKRVERKKVIKRLGPIEDENGQIHTEDASKAEVLNTFFSNVGQELAEKLPGSQKEQYSFINRITPTIDSVSVDNQHLSKQLGKIKPEKATGPDNIRAKDLSIAGEFIMNGIRGLFEKILHQKEFPQNWKCGKLKVAYKSGMPTNRGSYRPLSMLSILSKMLEGQICKPIDQHAERNKLYSTKQWGYSEGKSTKILLLLLTEKWKTAIDRGKVVGVLYIDLRKAFDSISHDILLEKLKGFGICGNLFGIVENYLNNRQQYTEVNGSRSKKCEVLYGVPQGSVLGPKMFKIFVNDLPENIKDGELYMFADDTTAYFIGSNVEEVIDGLNRIADTIHHWCIDNKLTINTEKTQAMLITGQKFVGPLRRLSIGGETIQFVDSARCLGVQIDKGLNWSKQVKSVAKSFSAKLSKLKRMKFLQRKVLEEIYYKSVIAGVVYCISVWGNCDTAKLNEIEKMHKRAAKLIYDVKGGEDPLEIANWKPISYLYKRRVATIMHEVHSNKLNIELTEMFEKKRYSKTRGTNNYVIPRPRTEHGRSSFCYRGPLTWNNLPESVKTLSTSEFKKKLRFCELEKIHYGKEAAIGTNKKDDFIYF